MIPVLYNICVDYGASFFLAKTEKSEGPQLTWFVEPAQLQACEARLSIELISILAGPRLTHCLAFTNIVCKILALMVSQGS